MAASTSLSATQRTLRAKRAANVRWSSPDARRHQADKRLERFADEVDPDRKLPEPERTALAIQRRRAHMQGLALKSSQARKTGGADAAT